MSDVRRVARISTSVLSREVQGEAVLLHLDSGEYFGLDSVGARIWQLLTVHGDLAVVEAAMREEYDVDPDVASRDLSRLVTELVDRKLIEIAEEPAAG